MKRNTGYSLIETLIYLALFAMLTIVFVNSVIVSMKSFSQIQMNRDFASGGTLALERITREIKGATSVGASTLNTSPGLLTLNTTDSSGNAKTVLFDVSNGMLRLTENGSVTGNLLGPNVVVSSLIFKTVTDAQGSAIKVELALQNTKGTITKNFYATAVVKGAY